MFTGKLANSGVKSLLGYLGEIIVNGFLRTEDNLEVVFFGKLRNFLEVGLSKRLLAYHQRADAVHSAPTLRAFHGAHNDDILARILNALIF